MHQNNYIKQQPNIFHILIEIKFLLLCHLDLDFGFKFESNSSNFGEYTLNLSDDLKKKSIKLLKRQQIYQKSKYHHFCLIDQILFFIMTRMDTLNHFNLRLVNFGIIHQKLEEIVGQIKTLITSFLFF